MLIDNQTDTNECEFENTHIKINKVVIIVSDLYHSTLMKGCTYFNINVSSYNKKS